MDQKSYYSVLQVPTTATQEQVQAAYKRLALLHHPDLSSDPQATQRMQVLNEAYEVLCSAEKRAQYDREQAAPNPPGNKEEGPPAGEQAPSGKQAAPQEKEASQPQPRPRTSAKEREAQAKSRRSWMRTQLKLLLGLSFLLLVLFFLSLLTGQVSAVAIFLIVLTAVGVIVSMVRKIRNPIF